MWNAKWHELSCMSITLSSICQTWAWQFNDQHPKPMEMGGQTQVGSTAQDRALCPSAMQHPETSSRPFPFLPSLAPVLTLRYDCHGPHARVPAGRMVYKQCEAQNKIMLCPHDVWEAMRAACMKALPLPSQHVRHTRRALASERYNNTHTLYDTDSTFGFFTGVCCTVSFLSAKTELKQNKTKSWFFSLQKNHTPKP